MSRIIRLETSDVSRMMTLRDDRNGTPFVLEKGELYISKENAEKVLGLPGSMGDGSKLMDFHTFLKLAYGSNTPQARNFCIRATGKLEEFALKGEVYDALRIRTNACLREDYFEKFTEKVKRTGAESGGWKHRLVDLAALTYDYAPMDAETAAFLREILSSEVSEERCCDYYGKAEDFCLLMAQKGVPVRMKAFLEAIDYQAG